MSLGRQDRLTVFGTHDARTVEQLQRCVAAEAGARAVLCADGHVGYSMPIGGVVAYREVISPSGVGYDIACGNLAAKTDVRAADVADWSAIASAIQRRISFGIGRTNDDAITEQAVFDRIAESPVPEQRRLLPLAREQLGTVGSGNHYVDLLEDEDGWVWIGVHFGSRGFVGGSMGDVSVILEGVDSAAAGAALYSTVHGAGRVMSRTQAAGRRHRRTGKVLKAGAVDWRAAQQAVRNAGVELRGGGPDEAPQVYRCLDPVLQAHAGTIRIVHRLRPRVVVMAGMNEYDPYKD